MISGVFDYVTGHTDWTIHIINTRTDIIAGTLKNSLKNADGLILEIDNGITQPEDILTTENPNLKMVVTNAHLVPIFTKYQYCRTLLIDNVSVGRDAARYFNSLGHFASYGFVHGAIRYPWSSEREEGFRSIMSHRTPLSVYPPLKQHLVSSTTSAPLPFIPYDKIEKWLDKLPKPAAVFAANDHFARRVLNACIQLGIKVPQQVTIVGCDNDSFIWQNTKPPLSSFQLPFQKLGFKAAQTLDRLLNNKVAPQRIIRVAGTQLCERGSSIHIPPATALVEKARNYITEHACNGIRVIDVVEHIGVSRSLLDLRFRQICGKSILEYILDTRLHEVCLKLTNTKRTILQIGHDCGFNDPDNLKRLFKKRFGISMRDFRNNRRTTGDRPRKEL